jgi:hypothetical protein
VIGTRMGEDCGVTDCHDITEILMKVALNTITLTLDIIYNTNYIHTILRITFTYR